MNGMNSIIRRLLVSVLLPWRRKIHIEIENSWKWRNYFRVAHIHAHVSRVSYLLLQRRPINCTAVASPILFSFKFLRRSFSFRIEIVFTVYTIYVTTRCCSSFHCQHVCNSESEWVSECECVRAAYGSQFYVYYCLIYLMTACTNLHNISMGIAEVDEKEKQMKN